MSCVIFYPITEILFFFFAEIQLLTLDETMNGLTQEREHQKTHYEAELAQLRLDYQEKKDELTSQTIALSQCYLHISSEHRTKLKCPQQTLYKFYVILY